MPVIAELDDAIIALRMVGAYEPADIRAALLDALAQHALVQPQHPPLVGLLFDVTRSESLVDRPAEEVRMMGRFLAAQSPRFGGRLALVASADYAFGLMRLGGVVLEGEGVPNRVFRDEPSARAWLRSPAEGAADR